MKRMKRIVSTIIVVIMLVTSFPLSELKAKAITREDQDRAAVNIVNALIGDWISDKNRLLSLADNNRSLCKKISAAEDAISTCMSTAVALGVSLIPGAAPFAWTDWAVSKGIDIFGYCVLLSIRNTGDYYVAYGKQNFIDMVNLYNTYKDRNGKISDPIIARAIITNRLLAGQQVMHGIGYYKPTIDRIAANPNWAWDRLWKSSLEEAIGQTLAYISGLPGVKSKYSWITRWDLEGLYSAAQNGHDVFELLSEYKEAFSAIPYDIDKTLQNWGSVLDLPPEETSFELDASKFSLTYTPSSGYQGCSYYNSLLRVSLTGNMRTDIINVALSQVGYHEGNKMSDLSGSNAYGGGNYTEYGFWFGKQVMGKQTGLFAPWCAMFISWCARQARVPVSVISNAKIAYADGANKQGGCDYFHVDCKDKSSYTPKPGDLIFFGSWEHVGLVSSVKNSRVYTIEGNANNQVKANSYPLNSSKIKAYGVPNYKQTSVLQEVRQKSLDYYSGSATYRIGSYTVTAKSGLNTRERPSAQSRKLSALKYGKTVNVTATDGNWGYVDSYGWICLDYTSYNGSFTSSYNQDVYYETGNYIVSTSSGLNCRRGPGTNYSKITALTNGTRFSVTETSGAWGYSPDYNGWLCLQYARYVAAPATVLPKPEAPNVTTKTSSEIGVGDIITVTWDAVEYAETYTAKLIDANSNSVVTTSEGLTSCTAAFATPYSGKFNVSVTADNSQQSSIPGSIYGIEAKAPSTVTFKDWDGKALSTQKVAYGKNATAPATPSRTGYTFKEWSASLNEIRSDETITAIYTRNSYTVRFLDHDGAVVDTQSVFYTDSATEPEYTAPSGYSFVKWDKDFSCITENTDITAVVSWTSQYPLEIQATSNVVRNNTTYISTAIVNNSPNAISNAKLILALKTAENKQLAYVESDSFTMAAGAKKTVNLSVEYDGASTVGNLFVVKDNDQKIPQSNQLVVSVDQGTAWSQWSTSTPPADALQVQSRTEYRYRDKEYKTSNSSTLNGYTLRTDVTNPSYSAWGSWSAWQDSAISANNLRDVGTQVVTVSQGYTEYRYKRLKSTSTTHNTFCEHAKRSGQSYYWQYTDWSTTRYPKKSSSPDWTCSYCGDFYTYLTADNDPYGNYWYYTEESRWVDTSYQKTQYRYRTRTATYYFERWPDTWSEWTPNKPDTLTNRAIDTRTTYRYVSNTPSNIEDTSGTRRTISGVTDASFANKHAIVHISSFDGTTQFIGQTKLGANGEYNFSFKLKDEPSVESGDYNVTLSIENTNAAIELDPILAPVPTYTVTFKDWDGAILSTQNVAKGVSADIPSAPEHEGYKFVKWNKSATNVTENMTVTAVYAVKSFGVVFLDDLNETSEIRTFNYGDDLEVPDVTAPEGYTFLGWDAVINGTSTVTENMVINAVFEKNTYTVTYLDHNDNVIDTVTVEYGDAPVAPAADDSENITVYGWNSDGDTVYVTEDATVRTEFDYNEYVETPSVSVETGTYMTAQTVTIDCPTDGATIYYTLDGTDPLSYLSDTQTGDSASYAPAKRSPAKAPSAPDAEPHIYNGPFTLNSSAKLVVAAVKDEMGDSGREESILAINTPSTEIKKHLVTLHLGLDQYETSFLVEDGAKIPNDEWYKSYFGYTLNGTFFDASKTAPVDLDSFVVMQSVDVYYDWTPTVYTVTFLASDGKELDSQQVEYLQDASAPAWPEIDGKTFSGWDNVYTNVSSDLIVKATYIDNTDLTTVSFDKSELTIKEGATESIVATVSLGGGSDNSQVFWESSNEEVVMVDDNGTVQAIKKGTATIYAVSEDSGMSAACEVTVESADPCDEGHSYGAWTRLDDNQHQRICTNNPAHVEKANHSWNAGVITTEAKCETNGIKTFTCTVCNATKTESIKALGHTSPNGHGNCDRCGKHLKDVDPGNNRPAGACKYCGQVHGGAFGWLIKFFHSILALLGLRKK